MNIDYSLPCRESNYRKGRNGVSFIVIHYTGNDNTTAWQNAHYFATSKVEASAQYFIDNDSIYASVPEGDTAWSVGVKYGNAPYWGICKNNNSINIELCTFGGEIQGPTIDKAAELVRHLMNKYGVPIDNVIRHYDVCAKCCPAPWVGGTRNDLWGLFKLYVMNISGGGDLPAPVVEPTPQGQDAQQYNKFIIACGQQGANDFVGHDYITVDGIVGPATRRMKVRVLQHAMNLDYGAGLAEDGIWGPATEAALGNHYVRLGEKQYLVSAIQIFLLIGGHDPHGVEYPGIFGNGLASAANTDYCDRNFIKFCTLI